MKKQTQPSYKPLVKLKDVEDFRVEGDGGISGDRRDGKLYRYTPDVKLHVNVAMATGRPLLLLGPTGCGKSSLAFNLARVMRRRYYEFVVTSRSEARDLFYRFDAVRRLGDAHLHVVQPAAAAPRWQEYSPYIDPGPLWWIVDPKSARLRGSEGITPGLDEVRDPAIYKPAKPTDAPAILLIDEIDKAEPDFANDLLVPLGSRQFTIDELAKTITFPPFDNAPERAPIVVITSNRERELPEAFVRRCIVLELKAPDEDALVAIAEAVSGAANSDHYRAVARAIRDLRGAEKLSVAEFLDTVRALDRLHATEPMLEQIVKSTSWRAPEY